MYYELYMTKKHQQKEKFLEMYAHIISPWKYNFLEIRMRAKKLQEYINVINLNDYVKEYEQSKSWFPG